MKSVYIFDYFCYYLGHKQVPYTTKALAHTGGMAEWSIALVLKTRVWETGPRVRISLPPRVQKQPVWVVFVCLGLLL